MTGPYGAPRQAALSEEAARLFEALQSWLATGAAATGAGSSSECRMCPLCQLLRVLQTARPEVFEHLSEAAGSLTAAVRAAVESADASWAAGQRRPVQRIDIG